MIRVALCMLALGGSACGHATRQVRATDVAIEGFYQANPDGSVSAAWPGVQLEVRFRGAWLTAWIADRSNPDRTPDLDRVKLTVDGREARWKLDAGARKYWLAAHLDPDRTHVARLWKMSEAEVGTMRVFGFESDGEIEAAEPPGALLEAVGDSITVGYGNMASGVSCGNHVPYTDSSQSYAALAARELKLGYRAIAYSGKGVVRNWDASEPDTLPQIYERALPMEPTSQRAPRAAEVVVVNLGTNDFGAGVPDQETFERELEGLLVAVRRRNPSAWIILALGPMLYDEPLKPARSLARAWLANVRDRRRTLGDTRMEALELWSDAADGLGCNYHPSLATHTRMAHELAASITRLRSMR